MSAKVAAPGVTRQAVLDYLIREADLDGLVTISEREIGDALGITQVNAGYHVRHLAADGVLTIVTAQGGIDGRTLNALQLAESAFA